MLPQIPQLSQVHPQYSGTSNTQYPRILGTSQVHPQYSGTSILSIPGYLGHPKYIPSIVVPQILTCSIPGYLGHPKYIPSMVHVVPQILSIPIYLGHPKYVPSMVVPQIPEYLVSRDTWDIPSMSPVWWYLRSLNTQYPGILGISQVHPQYDGTSNP